MEKNTKKILIGLIIVLVVYFGYELYLKYTVEESGYYDFENGIIQERVNGDVKVIEEKSLGLKMEVPSDWEYQAGYGYATIKDPTVNVDSFLRDFRDWTEGCSIGMSVERDENINDISTFDEEVKRIEEIKNEAEKYCHYDVCETFKKGENTSLREIFTLEDKELQINFQELNITILDKSNRRIYRINSFLSTQVPECEEDLNNFINSLEFK